MAQVQPQMVTVGNRVVGRAWVDGGAIEGSGGPARPRLRVPVTFTMAERSSEAQVAVVWLRARLLTSRDPFPQNQVSHPVSENLATHFPIRSGVSDARIQLEFPLTTSELEWLERRRHASEVDPLPLFVAVDVVVAALRLHNILQPHEAPAATPWDYSLGPFAEVMPFWDSRIDPLPVMIEPSTWVRSVLPGLGYHQRRLVEFDFPPALPSNPNALSEWDKARGALDDRRYGDAIAECRDLLSMWVKQTGARKAKPIADVLSDQNAWAGDDPRRALLDGLWKALTDFVNSPHHPESADLPQAYGAADARFVLLMTAVLSDYVSSLSTEP